MIIIAPSGRQLISGDAYQLTKRRCRVFGNVFEFSVCCHVTLDALLGGKFHLTNGN